jgi:hypothetical protein
MRLERSRTLKLPKSYVFHPSNYIVQVSVTFRTPYHHLLIILQVLAEDAIRSAIRDYRSKRANLADTQKTGFINASQTASSNAAASSST